MFHTTNGAAPPAAPPAGGALLAAQAFAATLSFEPTDANAVVCARGRYRAGSAGPNGAVVVRKPIVACTQMLVNGVSCCT